MTLPSPFAKEPLWVIVGKRRGSQTELRFFAKTFPPGKSQEEVLAHVERLYLTDQVFRRKWRGWLFMAVNASEYLEVDDTGLLMRHRNETERMAG